MNKPKVKEQPCHVKVTNLGNVRGVYLADYPYDIELKSERLVEAVAYSAATEGMESDHVRLPKHPTPSAYGYKGADGHDPKDGHKQLIGLSVQPSGSHMREREVLLFTLDQLETYARDAIALAHPRLSPGD